MRNFTEIEKQILNRIQKDWKITRAPFEKIAEDLKINEDVLIQHIDNLKRENIVREISAIFDARGLGYESALVAFEIPDAFADKAAEVINTHPGVSHNYLRDNRYNIWFTLSVKGKNSEDEVKLLADKVKAQDYLILKYERLFKIGVALNIGENDEPETRKTKQKIKIKKLTKTEKKAVYILQMDIPLVKRPYAGLMEKYNLDIDEKSIVRTGVSLKKEGIMRRYAAVLRHANAGYSCNAMTAWDIKDKNDKDVIRTFSPVQSISHLYKRTIIPGKWEHGLFAMIHARSEDELNRIIYQLEKESGIKNYLVLRSLKEFKKKRVKYFTEEFEKAL